RDPRATRTQPLRQRALGNELEFKFTRQHLTLELPVLANVRGQDFFHLACGEQNSHSETIYASVVADNSQALHAAVAQRRDQIFWNAAQPEPARSDRHVVVKQAVKRGGGVRINFAHVDEIWITITRITWTNRRQIEIRSRRDCARFWLEGNRIGCRMI